MLKDNKLSIFTGQCTEYSICKKDKSQVTTKMIISSIVQKNHITIAITLCYDFLLSHNAFILSRINITKEIYSKIKGTFLPTGGEENFRFSYNFRREKAL